jgi:hypothetical protein
VSYITRAALRTARTRQQPFSLILAGLLQPMVMEVVRISHFDLGLTITEGRDDVLDQLEARP